MAGLGRRTHYRKHLTDSVLNDFPEPKDDERIAKVVSTRGGNQFDILLPDDDRGRSCGDGDGDGDADREHHLAILPTKFRKLVWVKRNDYVIVQTGDDKKGADEVGDEGGAGVCSDAAAAAEDTGGIRYIITHILYKDQLKHLRSVGLWPKADPEFAGDVVTADEARDEQRQNGTTGGVDSEGHEEGGGNDGVDDEDEYDDGIVYDTGYADDDDLFVNTNRVARLTIADSSSESEDDESD